MRVLKNACPTRFTYGVPPAAVTVSGDGARCSNVVEDRFAWVFAQQRVGEQRGEEVAVDELAGVVDEEAAVRVAVPRDAEDPRRSRGPSR